MSESAENAMRKELEAAHEQLIERDQRITDLRIENAALRTHLDSVLATRAWRTAEQLRRLRSRVLRRET
jgi:hypothetical protein